MNLLVRSALLLAGLTALAACASGRGAFPRESNVPGAVSVDDVRVPDDVKDLVLTVYPSPRLVQYGTVLLPLAGAVTIDDASPEFDAQLRAASLDLGWKELPREGYLLDVHGEAGHTVIVMAARDDAGKRWAQQALAQITWETPSGRYVRECRVLDAPVFALRGNKRPQAWETKYRANFAWGARDDADTRGRTLSAVYAPQMPLDATGEGVARALESFRPWQDRGVRLFVVKFDDTGFGLTPESELRHGRFAPALVSYVKLVRQGLRRRDADAKLYLLPQTYWWNDPRFPAFAAAVREAGGLDEDVGLVLTGPDVISDEIDAAGLAAARRAFGLTLTKALVYDNRGREGDWGPIEGREAGLARHADGVFGERGTPVNRLTRLDWLWNPDGYDAEKSWRRAIYELAGPEGFASFEAVCRAFRDGAPRASLTKLVEAFAKTPSAAGATPVPRQGLVDLLRGDCSRIADPASPAAGAWR